MTIYEEMIDLFIELRGQGTAISAMDGEVLYSWLELGIPQDFMQDFFWNIAEDCENKQRNFPKSIVELDKKFQKFLKVKQGAL